jgi:hypothetical protein
MRTYIIAPDGVTLSHETPVQPGDNQLAITALDELRAAQPSSKQLLAIWNSLPGCQKQTRIGKREDFIERLWTALEALPEPRPARATKQAAVIALLRRPEGATVDEIRAATGLQPHTVRGLFSGALKKKLGLSLSTASEDRGRVYSIAAANG